MEYGVSALKAIPNFVQDAKIGMIISVEEFQVQSDGFATIQDLAYPIENFEM